MYQRYVKRLLDIILSLAATILLAIPMGIIALWIKADSPGPVFFRQRRAKLCGHAHGSPISVCDGGRSQAAVCRLH